MLRKMAHADPPNVVEVNKHRSHVIESILREVDSSKRQCMTALGSRDNRSGNCGLASLGTLTSFRQQLGISKSCKAPFQGLSIRSVLEHIGQALQAHRCPEISNAGPHMKCTRVRDLTNSICAVGGDPALSLSLS